MEKGSGMHLRFGNALSHLHYIMHIHVKSIKIH